MISKQAIERRSYVKSKLSVDSKTNILEFGAFDNPTFHKSLSDRVYYSDYFTSKELLTAHTGCITRSLENVVHVDYPIKSREISKHINISFDLLVANHVIEHIPDVVNWLNELEKIIDKSGFIFLSIPDKRYTFDYYRPISRSTEMLRAYEEKLTFPSQWQIVDHFYYHQKIDLVSIWEGSYQADFRPRFSLSEALQRARSYNNSYVDTHCWVFTPKSFIQAISDLRSANVLNLDIFDVQDTKNMRNELMVILKPNTI